MSVEALKEMFKEMVLKKDASLIPHYYHPDFLLFTNGQQWNYAQMLKMHEEIYQTPIQYQIAYDANTFVEEGERVAGRMWITTTLPDEAPHELELILIALYKEGKIFRLWELTYPDWSTLPEFGRNS